MQNAKLKVKNHGIPSAKYLKKIVKFAFYSLIFVVTVGWTVTFAQQRNGIPEGVYVGIFRQGAPENMTYIQKYVEQVGKKPAMVMWYEDWEQPFPLTDLKNVAAFGAVPHIVWEPWYWGDHSKIKLNDIINGKWDSYIHSWAKASKAYAQPIFLRVAHEFNIEGYPWGVINNDKNPDTYIKAYRHVVDIFKSEGAQNVKWIWCFMNYSYPDEAWNDWPAAYPGDQYVDWIGIDGYNWGNTQSWSQWQPFKYLFRDQVRRAKTLWPQKPIMVAEFASTDKGGDKAAWIKEIPGYLKTSMRDINAIVWFDENKETDWRIKSSSAALSAYKSILKDPLFLSDGKGLAELKNSFPRINNRTKKQASILRAPSVVKIDGTLAEWDKSSPISMKDASFLKEGVNWGGPADLSGDIYLMWDESNLYLAAQVTDKIPLVNKKLQQNIWDGDAIEMVLGLKEGLDPKRASFDSGDNQIGFGTGDGKDYSPLIWNWQRRRSPKDSEICVEKVSSPLGYVLEAKIPWSALRESFVPEKGKKIGFDIALDDADFTRNRERQFIWNGDFFFYRDPNVWGVLEFK